MCHTDRLKRLATLAERRGPRKSLPFAITWSWRRLNEPEEDVPEPSKMRNSKNGGKPAPSIALGEDGSPSDQSSFRESLIVSVSGLTT